jgi:hypothetical protein
MRRLRGHRQYRVPAPAVMSAMRIDHSFRREALFAPPCQRNFVACGALAKRATPTRRTFTSPGRRWIIAMQRR